jgi:hypothetical protein
MTGYISLYIIFIIISLSYAGIVSKRYTEKLVPYLWNDKTNWNPNIDRLKLLLSSTLFISPIIFFKSFIKYNSSNIYFNYLGFSILIILLTFCFWFDLKKINHMKEIKIFNKKNDTADEFKNNLEKLKVKQDKLEFISRDIISKVDNNHNEVLNFKEDTLDNFSDVEKGVSKIRKETKENRLYFTENFNVINNELSKIKDKSKPKKRVSDIRDEKINKIKSEFEILVNDLRKFEYYDDGNSLLLNNSHGISELESYQILVVFFQRYYNFPEEKTNNIIYNLFNDHFSISLVNGINSGNWNNFKNKILDDIENQIFYSDLILNHNKIHSTVE